MAASKPAAVQLFEVSVRIAEFSRADLLSLYETDAETVLRVYRGLCAVGRDAGNGDAPAEQAEKPRRRRRFADEVAWFD